MVASSMTGERYQDQEAHTLTALLGAINGLLPPSDFIKPKGLQHLGSMLEFHKPQCCRLFFRLFLDPFPMAIN